MRRYVRQDPVLGGDIVYCDSIAGFQVPASVGSRDLRDLPDLREVLASFSMPQRPRQMVHPEPHRSNANAKLE